MNRKIHIRIVLFCLGITYRIWFYIYRFYKVIQLYYDFSCIYLNKCKFPLFRLNRTYPPNIENFLLSNVFCHYDYGNRHTIYGYARIKSNMVLS